MDERLNEINRELKELNEALARQGRMEAQWKDLQDQRAERDRRVMETGRVFRKEQDDVDRLEKGGLRALLLSLTGDREVRLSKERREALAAKLQYDQAQRDLEDLDGRIGVLLREKDGLRIDRIRRDALLEEKGELLKALGGRPAPGSPGWTSSWTSWSTSAGRWGRPSLPAARRKAPCPPCWTAWTAPRTGAPGICWAAA